MKDAGEPKDPIVRDW